MRLPPLLRPPSPHRPPGRQAFRVASVASVLFPREPYRGPVGGPFLPRAALLTPLAPFPAPPSNGGQADLDITRRFCGLAGCHSVACKGLEREGQGAEGIRSKGRPGIRSWDGYPERMASSSPVRGWPKTQAGRGDGRRGLEGDASRKGWRGGGGRRLAMPSTKAGKAGKHDGRKKSRVGRVRKDEGR